MLQETIEMLSEISRTAEMGKNTLRQLEQITPNEAFQTVIRIQRKAYEILQNEAEVQYDALGMNPKEENTKNKVMTYMGIKMETWQDKSDTHIAEMIIEGTNQGIMKLTEAQHNCPQADKTVQGITENAIKMLQRNIEELKPFL